MASVNDIRNTFLDYFGKNDHEVVASSSLVPLNDPLLFTTMLAWFSLKTCSRG